MEESKIDLILGEPSHAQMHGWDKSNALAKRPNEAKGNSNPREALGGVIKRTFKIHEDRDLNKMKTQQ